MDRLRDTVAGGAAALAGLLFVGLSLNLSEVLKYPGVPRRAVATARADRRDPSLIAGAVSLWLPRGGGLYWITAAVATGFVAATANAWVLLVEIKR